MIETDVVDQGLCDEAFLEQVRSHWDLSHGISNFDRVLAIAERCKSQLRLEEELVWLRKRMDEITQTDFAGVLERKE